MLGALSTSWVRHGDTYQPTGISGDGAPSQTKGNKKVPNSKAGDTQCFCCDSAYMYTY